MHKSKFKRIALAVCFAFLPFSAQSAGLGKLTVMSGLGEPLRAEIDLVSTTPEELSSLSAAIAPQEAYAVQGIERSSIHSAIQIEVVKKSDSSAILKLSTRQPIDDPFLDMLIQVDWATGRLLREYTVLLDPPGYEGTQTRIVTTPAVPALTPQPIAARPIPAPASSPASAIQSQPEAEYTTKSGDTLHKIAKDMQVQGYNLDQMLVGIYRANKQAFAGENMNRLKVGQIIKAPSSDDLSAITQQEAVKEIRVQTSDWNAYRNRLAGVVAESAPMAEDAGDQAASGKLKTATEDRAAPADTGPKDVIKLSKSEAAKLNADATNAKAMQEKLSALQEENIARQQTVNEANERVSMLEKQVADLQALLTIKDKALAGLQDGATATAEPTAETAPQTETNVVHPENTTASKPDEAVTESSDTIEPVAKPVVKKKPVTAPEPVVEPGLLDSLADNSSLLGLAGAALVLLGGGWLFLRNRRKRNLDSFEQGILTAGGLKANTVFGNTSGGTVDTGDTSFLTDFSQSPSGMIDTHDVDPIAEAEVYMAYGRDSQAEEILNDAISKEPTRYELHLKLLEIFAGRNDTSAFEAIAGELYSTLGSSDPVWIKVAEMGKKLEPSNPLYDLTKAHVPATSIEAAAAATTVMSRPIDMEKLDASDFDNAEVMTGSSLDFSLDAEPGLSTDSDQTDVKDSSLDFDLGFDSGKENTSASSEVVSMDDTQQLEAGGMQDSALDFDMSFADETADASEKSMPKTASEPEAVNFDQPEQFEEPSFTETLPNLELPEISAAEKANPDLNLESSFLDIGSFDDSAETKPSDDVDLDEVKEASSSGLDFNFDLGDEAETSEAKVESSADMQDTGANNLEMDLSGISLDMDTPDVPSDVEEITITHDESEDVNTKLDLVTAYMDMGDTEGARELLDEVLKEGGARQRERAQELLNTLS